MGFADAAQLPPEKDSGEIRGKQYHIACLTWFTADGTPKPLKFKFMGDDGTIQAVNEIKVNYSEEKYYSGIPSKEYSCEAVIGGLLRYFKLVFYMEASQWVMLV